MDNELRGAVLTKFRSITAFAEALHWDRKKASRIVNRVQTPTVNDMEEMAKLLSVATPDAFVTIFLPTISTMWK